MIKSGKICIGDLKLTTRPGGGGGGMVVPELFQEKFTVHLVGLVCGTDPVCD